MGELGDRLRQAREARGLSLRQVEAAIFIRHPFLQALEEERFAGLPGDVYTRGFIRNYAAYLGLDPAELLKLYRPAARANSAGAPHVIDQPLVPYRGVGPLGRVLWGVLLVILVGAIAWLAYQRYYLRVVPWPLSLLPGMETAAPPAQPSPTLPAIVPTAIPTAEPEVTLAPTATEEPTAAPAEPPASPSPTPADAATIPTMTALPPGVTVQAECTDATYLQVTGDGETLFVGLLRPGQVMAWTATTRLALRVGNAGVTRLTVNGIVQPSLGALGQVVQVEYAADSPSAPQ